MIIRKYFKITACFDLPFALDINYMNNHINDYRYTRPGSQASCKTWYIFVNKPCQLARKKCAGL